LIHFFSRGGERGETIDMLYNIIFVIFRDVFNINLKIYSVLFVV